MVIPAKAGIHVIGLQSRCQHEADRLQMDPRFRGDDESESAFAGMTNFPGVYALPYRLTTFPVRADS
jgi:hypothetical protein